MPTPVEAKFGVAARHIAFVAALGTSPSLVGVLWLSIGIEAYKDCVVVVCRFINHAFMNKGIQYLTVDTPAVQEIGEHPPHIVVLRRQYKRFFFLLYRWRNGKCPTRSTQQIFYRFRIGLIVKAAYKVHRIATDLFILVIPQVSSNGDLLSAVHPFAF